MKNKVLDAPLALLDGLKLAWEQHCPEKLAVLAEIRAHVEENLEWTAWPDAPKVLHYMVLNCFKDNEAYRKSELWDKLMERNPKRQILLDPLFELSFNQVVEELIVTSCLIQGDGYLTFGDDFIANTRYHGGYEAALRAHWKHHGLWLKDRDPAFAPA